jgi:uncharacterized protein (DUF433 family)
MAAPTTLNQPLYSIGEASRFLGLPRNTLKRWLEGTRVAGRFYPPVIRSEPAGVDTLSWPEFVEAGLLREYRTEAPLQKMRPFIEAARDRFSIPYPLAHYRPLVENHELVYELQAEVDLDEGLYLVRLAPSGDQLQLAQPVKTFLRNVEFEPNGFVRLYRPQGPQSPVVLDPATSFGIPQINGIRTEALTEAVEAGETVDSVASEWGVSKKDVTAAIRWETLIGRLAVAA